MYHECTMNVPSLPLLVVQVGSAAPACAFTGRQVRCSRLPVQLSTINSNLLSTPFCLPLQPMNNTYNILAAPPNRSVATGTERPCSGPGFSTRPKKYQNVPN